MQAVSWDLDEFPVEDVFADVAALPPVGQPQPATSEQLSEAIEVSPAERFAAERARIEADAYARGRADGEAAAHSKFEEAITHATGALNDAVLSVQMHEARWLGNVEENVAALAVLVARHVVQREVLVDHTFVSDLVVKALTQYPVDEEITVRMHPDDFVACRPVLDQVTSSGLGAGVRTLRWLADANIQRGGCLTEGRERIIDGRVDTSLERAYRMLAGIQA